MSAKRGAIGALCLAGLLCGCSTPYQSASLAGRVEVHQVNGWTARVSAHGGRFIAAGRLNEYVMLAAAQTTLAQGYDLFEIVGDAESPAVVDRQTFAITPSGQALPVTAMARYSTASTFSYPRPGEDLVIQMFTGRAPAHPPAMLFDARDVVAHLGPRLHHPGPFPTTSDPRARPDDMQDSDAEPSIVIRRF